jgi:hypothetical protein
MSHASPAPNAFDYAPLLAQQYGTSTDEITTELSREITALSDWVGSRAWSPVEQWPFERGPDGPMRTEDGGRLHGAARSDPHPDQPTFDLLIANNGFPISAVRCAGPVPPALPLMTPISCVVANTGALVRQPDGLAGLDPDDAAIHLVIHRRKPVALLTADDATVLERWQRLADEHGCEVDVEHVKDDCCGYGSYWFVEVARRERLGDLLALDDLIEWWSVALPAVGLGSLRDRVERDLLDLADRPTCEFIGRGSDLVLAPLCDDSPADGLPTWVVGAVLGYWPPTSLALMLNFFHRGSLVPSTGEVDLRTWRALHGAPFWRE